MTSENAAQIYQEVRDGIRKYDDDARIVLAVASGAYHCQCGRWNCRPDHDLPTRVV